MLDLMFYSKGTKPFAKEVTCEWATIFCEEDDYDSEFVVFGEFLENCFTRGSVNFREVPVFESDIVNLDSIDTFDSVFESIENIIEKEKPEVILISTMDFFKKVIHFSEENEMEPQMIITENRQMLYYAMIGKDKCALLVAWDCYEETEEETEY